MANPPTDARDTGCDGWTFAMKILVESFVAAINSGRPDAVAALMTDDHSFMDSLGNRVSGRDAVSQGWVHYFSMVPDYRISVDRIMCDGDRFILVGRASGTYSPDGVRTADRHWNIPAAWQGLARDGRVAEWQVFGDNKPMYDLMDARKRPSP